MGKYCPVFVSVNWLTAIRYGHMPSGESHKTARGSSRGRAARLRQCRIRDRVCPRRAACRSDVRRVHSVPSGFPAPASFYNSYFALRRPPNGIILHTMQYIIRQTRGKYHLVGRIMVIKYYGYDENHSPTEI